MAQATQLLRAPDSWGRRGFAISEFGWLRSIYWPVIEKYDGPSPPQAKPFAIAPSASRPAKALAHPKYEGEKSGRRSKPAEPDKLTAVNKRFSQRGVSLGC